MRRPVGVSYHALGVSYHALGVSYRALAWFRGTFRKECRTRVASAAGCQLEMAVTVSHNTLHSPRKAICQATNQERAATSFAHHAALHGHLFYSGPTFADIPVRV